MKAVSVTMTAISEKTKMKKISPSPHHLYFFGIFPPHPLLGSPADFHKNQFSLFTQFFLEISPPPLESGRKL